MTSHKADASIRSAAATPHDVERANELQAPPSPDAILQLGLAFWGSKTLLSAVELDLFTELAMGPLTQRSSASGSSSTRAVSHTTDSTVSRIDPGRNAVAATINVGPQRRGVAVSARAVWVVNSGGPTVSRIDRPANRVVATIRVGPARAASEFMSVAAGGGAFWVGVPNLNAVVRIDPATNAVGWTIRSAGQTCGFLAADQNAVLAAGDRYDNYVARLDPHSNR
jgi:hypothetical protein